MWIAQKKRKTPADWLYPDYKHSSYMGSRRLERTFSSSKISTYKYANLTKSKAFKLYFVKYYVGNRTKPNQMWNCWMWSKMFVTFPFVNQFFKKVLNENQLIRMKMKYVLSGKIRKTSAVLLCLAGLLVREKSRLNEKC